MLNDLKKASDDQVARLGGVEEQADKQIVQALDDMSQMQELIKDFNLFESLYRAQQDLTQQSQAYNRPGQLGREDQLALKDLAGRKNRWPMRSTSFNKNCARTPKPQKIFSEGGPKRAQLGGPDWRTSFGTAGGTGHRPDARGDGDRSFQLADRLRGEMEKLFGQCQGGNCPSGNELDSYLRLQRMNPGNNFAQMSRSRKFGFGNGRGQAGGMGEGQMGMSGYAAVDGSTLNVMGNESSIHNGNAAARQSSRYGKGAGALAAGAKGEPGNPDVMKGLNPVNRQSGAVSSETVIEEYNDLVDSYFKAITTKKEKPANEKSN